MSSKKNVTVQQKPPTKKGNHGVPGLRHIARGRWRLTVPAGLSESGKQTCHNFSTPHEAREYRKQLERAKAELGKDARGLSPKHQQLAAEALEILKDYGIDPDGLKEVTQLGAERIARRERCPTLASAVTEFLAGKESGFLGKGHRPVTSNHLRALSSTLKSLVDSLGDKPLSDIEETESVSWLHGYAKTPPSYNLARSHAKSFFKWCVDRGWLADNPLNACQKKHVKGADDVLTVTQVRNVFNCCTDLTQRNDLTRLYRLNATKAAPAFALMLFGGVRFEESKKLQWDAVHFDHGLVRIDSTIAKTKDERDIDLNPTLRAWLQQVPERERSGKIAPANWPRIYSAVRKASGVSGLRNPFRTSFGSYLIVSETLSYVQRQMGHSTPETTISHYRTLVPVKQAPKFWSVLPEGEESTVCSDAA